MPFYLSIYLCLTNLTNLTNLTIQILEAILKIAFLIALHELGHYIMAYRLGWNPKFAFRWGWMPAFVVKTELEVEVNNETDFYNLFVDLASFSVMGSLFSIIGIWILIFCDLLTHYAGFGLVSLFAVYGFWEVTHPTAEIKGETS